MTICDLEKYAYMCRSSGFLPFIQMFGFFGPMIKLLTWLGFEKHSCQNIRNKVMLYFVGFKTHDSKQQQDVPVLEWHAYS